MTTTIVLTLLSMSAVFGLLVASWMGLADKAHENHINNFLKGK